MIGGLPSSHLPSRKCTAFGVVMSILSLAAWEPVEEVVSGDRGSLAGGSDQEKLCGADGARVGNLLERRMPVSLRQCPDQAMRAYHCTCDAGSSRTTCSRLDRKSTRLNSSH